MSRIIIPSYGKPKEKRSLTELAETIMKQPTINIDKVHEELEREAENKIKNNVDEDKKSPIDRLGII